MTNREKATELTSGMFNKLTAYHKLTQMAEWKDQQFKEYLEKKYKEASHSYDKTEAKVYEDKMDYINEIINEIFPEPKEQDNSDREE